MMMMTMLTVWIEIRIQDSKYSMESHSRKVRVKSQEQGNTIFIDTHDLYNSHGGHADFGTCEFSICLVCLDH
jgi:hypothetical protein